MPVYRLQAAWGLTILASKIFGCFGESYFFDTEDQPGNREEVVMVLRAQAPPSCWLHLEWQIAIFDLSGDDLVRQL